METPSYQKAKDKMAIRRPRISIITLNVSGLNSLANKEAQIAEWIKKTKPNHMLPPRDTSQLQRQI